MSRKPLKAAVESKIGELNSPGIRAIVSQGLPQPLHEYRQVPVEWVESDPNQPRRRFDPEKLEALAEDLRRHGIDHPLDVRTVDSNRYRLIAGERRLRAARMAGLQTVPIFVRDDLPETEVELLQLRENVQREELSPVEEARKLLRIKEITGFTWREVALEFGWKENTVHQKVRILEAPGHVQGLLESGGLTVGHYSRICALPEEMQVQLADRAASEGLSVRDLREAVKARAEVRPPALHPSGENEPRAAEGGETAGPAEDGRLEQEGLSEPSSQAWSPPAPPPALAPSDPGEIAKLTAKVTRPFHRLIRHRAADLAFPTVADYLRWAVETDLRQSGYLSTDLSTECAAAPSPAE